MNTNARVVRLNKRVERLLLKGSYPEALRLALAAVDIGLGSENLYYATSLCNLARINLACHSSGAKISLPLFEQALEIRKCVLGAEHPDYATNLDEIASIHHSLGNYSLAKLLYEQTLEIRRKALGTKHRDYAKTLADLADIICSLGDKSDAISLYEKSLNIRKTLLGTTHPDYTITLCDLAESLYFAGNHKRAIHLFDELLEIHRNMLAKGHLDWNRALDQLGRIIHRRHRRFLDMHFSNGMIENYPDFGSIQMNLVYALASLGNDFLALQVHIAAMNEAHERCTNAIDISDLPSLANTDMYALLSLVRSTHFVQSVEIARLALDIVLRRKSVVFEAELVLRNSAEADNNHTLLELGDCRKQIAHLAITNSVSEEAISTKLELLNHLYRSLQRSLEHKVGLPGLVEQKLKMVNGTVVAESLPEQSGLIEFVRYEMLDFKPMPFRSLDTAQTDPQSSQNHPPEKDHAFQVVPKEWYLREASPVSMSMWKSSRYLAFVISAADPDNVKMVDLGEAKPIDDLIAKFRQSMSGEPGRGILSNETLKQMDFEPIGYMLRELVFDKLIPCLPDKCTRLFLCPDGELSKLPFEVLPDNNNGYLIDEYQISYLGCGRDALRFNAQHSGEQSAPIIVADPDFNLKADMSVDESIKKQNHAELIGVTGVSYDLRSAKSKFGRLKGSRIEAKSIASMLGVKPWLGKNALEPRLKACQSPRILHIATHGFFLEDQEVDRSQDNSISRASDKDLLKRMGGGVLEHPLLRSGLVFSGANTWWKRGNLHPEAEDGILTAEEVANMDLRATDLVVLSACDTGLGDIKVGEGVFGLRRSFILAGAKTLVMSLWKVPDKETQELMTEFYRQMLEEHKTCGEALRNAQKKIMNNEEYANKPFYWGAFICQGDADLRIVDSQNSTIAESLTN